jgi:hypothetical protein
LECGDASPLSIPFIALRWNVRKIQSDDSSSHSKV